MRWIDWFMTTAEKVTCIFCQCLPSAKKKGIEAHQRGNAKQMETLAYGNTSVSMITETVLFPSNIPFSQ